MPPYPLRKSELKDQIRPTREYILPPSRHKKNPELKDPIRPPLKRIYPDSTVFGLKEYKLSDKLTTVIFHTKLQIWVEYSF